MGLDTVELVMKMEETFGIVIDDLDAERIGTVGQSYRYILDKLRLRQATPCPSARLFYRLRRGWMARPGIDRREIRPSARIDDILPKVGRRAAWIGLTGTLGVIPPPMVLAPWQSRAAMAVGLGSGFAFLGLAIAIEGITPGKVPVAAALVVTFTGLAWASAYVLLLPFAATIPAGSETVRGLIGATLDRHFTLAEGIAKTWTPDEVWAALRDLVSEQAGVARDRITEDTHFVHDLGMD